MERRRTVRRVPEHEEPLARVRLRTGSELAVVNVSNAGVLVEGSVRLLPGRHLDVHVVTQDGRVLVRCRVVRSFVCHLEADAVRYRSALAFDRPVDTAGAGHPFPFLPSSSSRAEGSSYSPLAAPAAPGDETCASA
jgi:hypothetical protein